MNGPALDLQNHAKIGLTAHNLNLLQMNKPPPDQFNNTKQNFMQNYLNQIDSTMVSI